MVVGAVSPLPVGCSVPAHPDAALGLEEGPQATHESTDGKVCVFPPLAGRRGYGRGPIRDYYYPAFATHDRSNCRIRNRYGTAQKRRHRTGICPDSTLRDGLNKSVDLQLHT